MNILHIDTGREMRGGQWQAFYLIRGLMERGHRVRLLAPVGSPLLQAAEARGIEVRPLRWTSLIASLAGIDLIHTHDARAHTIGLLCGKPVLVSRRVAFPIRRTPASTWKYRRARHYLAVSQFVKSTLLAANIPADRISVVYDGVPAPPQRRQEGAPSYVVALDSEDPAKGKRIIEKAAELANIAVHFSNNLVRDLPDAALFVYITELEGLGSAALLAMAAGAPVLASRVGGLPEIVEDEVSGLLTTNEPDAIASRMARLLNDRPLATRLANAARSRVEERFSLERMILETIRVYERILS